MHSPACSPLPATCTFSCNNLYAPPVRLLQSAPPAALVFCNVCPPFVPAGTTSNFDDKTQPFCSQDAISSSVALQFDKIGFASMTHSRFLAQSGLESGSGVDFCLRGDCDALGMDNGKIAVISVSQVDGVSVLQPNASTLADFTKTKASSRAFASHFITHPPSSPQPPHKPNSPTTPLHSTHLARLTNCPRPFPTLSSPASRQGYSLLISPAEHCWTFPTFPSAFILLAAPPCLLVCQKELSTICDQCQTEATL